MTWQELPEVDLLGLPSIPRPKGVLSTDTDIIDNNNNPDPSFGDVVVKLDQALRRYGGCYLRNHGIRASSMSNIFSKSKEFFKLPATLKDAYAKAEDKMSSFGGYYVSQNERFRERFDIMNCCSMTKYPKAEVAGFQAAVENYREDCNALTQFLLTVIARAFEVEDSYFVDQHRGTLLTGDATVEAKSHLSTIFYNNLDMDSDKAEGEANLLMKKHTDFTSLTILATSAKGLQVQPPEKQDWFDADPREGCVLLNVGDLMEMWTGGHYPATVHRVLKMSHEDSEGRQSIPYFVHPDYSALVSPIVEPVRGKAYEPVRALDYWNQRMGKKPSVTFLGKGWEQPQTPATA